MKHILGKLYYGPAYFLPSLVESVLMANLFRDKIKLAIMGQPYIRVYLNFSQNISVRKFIPYCVYINDMKKADSNKK